MTAEKRLGIVRAVSSKLKEILRGILVVLLTLALALLIVYRDARAAEIEPFIAWTHGSDILRGPPLNRRAEPQYDFVGVGVTIRWRKVEWDLAHGFQIYDCNYHQTSATATGCRFESGSMSSVRYYWRRK